MATTGASQPPDPPGPACGAGGDIIPEEEWMDNHIQPPMKKGRKLRKSSPAWPCFQVRGKVNKEWAEFTHCKFEDCHQSCVVVCSMDVVRGQLEDTLPVLESLIQGCDCLALHMEFTGLHSIESGQQPSVSKIITVVIFRKMTLNISKNGWFHGREIRTSDINLVTTVVISAGLLLLVSLLGIGVNSLVFWCLRFSIKVTKYTVYIINLAVADLICLCMVSIIMCIAIVFFEGQMEITNPVKVIFGLEIILGIGTYADMFFLTAISIERCIFIVYPIWYCQNRPKAQSVIVCFLIWCVSCLVTLVDNLVCPPELFGKVTLQCTEVHTFLALLVLLICMPVMVISILIMLIRIPSSSRHTQSSRFVTVIMACVIVFLISIAPMRFIRLLLYLQVLPSDFSTGLFFFTMYLFITLNSSLKPIIYCMVGNRNMQANQESFVKAPLKNVFEEEEEEDYADEQRRTMRRDTIESSVS